MSIKETPLLRHRAPRSRARKRFVVCGSMLRRYFEAQALTAPVDDSPLAATDLTDAALVLALPVTFSPTERPSVALLATTNGTRIFPTSAALLWSYWAALDPKRCSCDNCARADAPTVSATAPVSY